MTALLSDAVLLLGAVLAISFVASAVCEAMERREKDRVERNRHSLARVLKRATKR